MMDAYTNHITLITEHEFRQMGLDKKSAHILNGGIIRRACDSCPELDRKSIAVVHPHMKGFPHHATEESVAQRYKKTEDYWLHSKDYFTRAHVRKQHDKAKPRVTPALEI